MVDEVTNICEGFKARMATIPGLHPYASPPDNLNFPAAYVDGPLPGTSYERVFCPSASYLFHTIVAVSVADGLGTGSALVKPYLARTGTKSIVNAVLGDATLGGACQTVLVRNVIEDSAVRDINDSPCWIGAIEWEVIT